MKSNCYLWARAEYKRREREWRRAGMPPGKEPYWVERPTRKDPRCLEHRFVGRYLPESDTIALESFKPEKPTNAPWYLAWTHLFFRGRVKPGDFPETEPVNEPHP